MGAERVMKNYHFSCGNSTIGSIGLCAEVVAETRKEAIEKLRIALQDSLGPSEGFPVLVEEASIRYINVYVNPDALGACEVEEREDCDPPR
jgi:hypothetical protein